MYYRFNNRKGSSGAPLWIEKEGKILVIGIHKSGKRLKNWGVEITQEVYDQLWEWIKT